MIVQQTVQTMLVEQDGPASSVNAAAAQSAQAAAAASASSASSSASAAASSATAAANSAAAAATSAGTITTYASLPTEYRQYAAAGSVLSNIPTRIDAAEQLLKQAVGWWDAGHSSASGQSLTNLGWGGSALNATLGSTSGVDSNDPLFLPWSGQNYVYLPGVAYNYLSVPNSTALQITGDLDLRGQVAVDNWTLGAVQHLVAKMESAGQFAYRLYAYNNYLYLEWSADGTNIVSKQSTATLGYAAGTIKWVRGTLTVNNGAAGNDVKFYTSDDGVTWTQLGTTVTTAGTTSIYAGTSIVGVGDRQAASGQPLSGKVYRAQIFNGINGTPVLDVDTSLVSSGAATSFPALTGQTVTINRATSGRKSVAVVNPAFLFGTDDYMQVADNALLNFGATDSMTAVVVVRQWSTPSTNSRYISKKALNFGTDAGWAIYSDGTGKFRATDSDGTNYNINDSPATSLGSLGVGAMVISRTAALLTPYANAIAGSTGNISALGNMTNTLPLRIGSDSSIVGGNADMEFIAAAIFRRALTASEITTINNYYLGRYGA